MTTNYPGAIDSLSNPGSTDPLSAGHAAQHANANDAIEAIEGELGTDPAGASATVKARFGVIEANDWVTTDRIADSQVTSAKILDGTIVNADVGAAAAIAATKVAGTAVTQADTGTVTSTMILDGTVVNGDINAAAAIAATKVAGTAVTQADTGTVTSAMLLNGTIVDADVNASADIAKTKIAGTAVTVADTGTVTSTMILDDTIVNADINASAAIVGTKLADGAITPIKTSGGYVAKTALYTPSNDDRVIDCTSGTYTVTLPTAASQTGRTFIIRNSGTGTITIGRTGAETIAGATSQTLAGYGQLEVISNGTNWLVVRGSYADETVGRRIFTWNSAYSSGTGGWQMTFGDTGWRDVSAGLEAGTTGEWRMRRVNSTVTHHVYNVTNSSGVMYNIPAGFRTASYGTVIPLTKWDLTAGAVLLNSPAPGNCTLSDGLKGYTGAYYMFTHDTSEAWPTSLPGSAVGSIPA